MQPEKLNINPGQMFGVYQTTEFIARGGFSEVWSAWDTRLERIVAIKLLVRNSDDHAETMQFAREAAAIAQLQHPNIVPLYDYGQTSGVYYLVTRYVIGGSLGQMIEKEHLTLTASLSLMRYVAEALDYVHAQQIVHRDLKPPNILIDANGMAYLTDFGLARRLESGSLQVHSISGTPVYMPPEQIAGREITTYSDQFSFGIILFRLLTGELPFQGKGALGMRQLSTKENLPDPRLINPALPSALTSILQSLTAFDPSARPSALVPVVDTIMEVLHSEDNTIEFPSGTAIEFPNAPQSNEAELANLLERALPFWEKYDFVLSLTHFVLLNVLIGNERGKQSESVQSLMLRGALQYDQQISEWWAASSEAARQRACFHALKAEKPSILLRTLPLITPTAWASQTDSATLNGISALLVPVSDSTPIALDFLESALPSSKSWTDDTQFTGIDQALATLANTISPYASRAATLIGRIRHTPTLNSITSLPSRLTAYEVAGSLPDSIPIGNRVILTIQVAARQLMRNRRTAIRQYLWAAAGCTVALGWLIYEVFRSTDFLSNRRILNTLGNGLLFGLIYGLAIWISRHIMENARILPRGWRLLLAITIGAGIFALGANLFQNLLYDDVLDPGIALLSGVLFVGGFALSVGMNDWLQFILGAFGVIMALLVPWSYYLNDGTRAPFIFDDQDPNSAIPMTLIASILLSLLALGYLWKWGKQFWRIMFGSAEVKPK